ncbi:MAG TPA: leucine--tRNA ligase, partial [Coxiellaceae bacterium]|nr:leucine--tRNA ligase [Coxiellaceae bacterium]
MNKIYQPQIIEEATQKYWEESKAFEVTENPNKQKFYCLSMWPYPSGHIHMGHVRNYTIGDVIARYQRMLGKNVMQPLGWDAFGLPAENAALKNNLAPSTWTYQNIEQMRITIKQMGFAIDWSREITACRPEYYKFEQQLFLKMYEKGLAYKKKSLVNWDPVDQTVLANEQVVDGRGWRSGALVERKEISQWFLKITAYADELLNDLDKLPGWPEQVKTMQRNWIGRSEGLELYFPIVGSNEKVTVFTTRPDTVFGATFLSIAPEHPLATVAAKTNATIAKFLQKCHNIKVAEAEAATIHKEG